MTRHGAPSRRLSSPLVLLAGLAVACGGSGEDDAASVDPGAGEEPTLIDMGPVDPPEGAPEGMQCEGFDIDEGTWSVEPGENTDYCVRIPTPVEWRDRDLALTGWNWDVSTAHHLFVEYSPIEFPGATMDPVPCDGVEARRTFSFVGSANQENSRLIFGAGEGTGNLRTLPGYGKLMTANGHFRTSHHVINPSPEPVDVNGKFRICAVDADTVPHLINTLVCTTTAINVPSGQRGAATATCTAPFDMDLTLLASHAHDHLDRFTMRFYDGERTHDEVIYESLDWDSPQIVNLDEPLHLKAGQGITYACEYEGPVWFEDGAESPEAEHCAAFMAYAFPPGDKDYELPPPLVGVALSPDEVSQAFESPAGSPI